jgi:hypothetical protein
MMLVRKATESTEVLKGRGFSHAVKVLNTDAAFAAEGMPIGNETLVEGMYPEDDLSRRR